MDQPYYIPAQANPAQSAGGATSEDAADSHRSTMIYRLPQSPYFILPEAQNEITAGRLLFHLFLLALTILTTAGVGALWFSQDGASLAQSIESGVIYSFTIIVILASHELGHYIACRWYGVSATLPYFIPVPIPPVGTFGAFIKIKSPIPTRRALFDIGIAGPLAGFVFIVPAAVIAHYFAEPAALQVFRVAFSIAASGEAQSRHVGRLGRSFYDEFESVACGTARRRARDIRCF